MNDSQATNSIPVQVGIALIIHAGHVVTGLRQAHQVLGGYYEFPGGKVERDETIVQTVVRESLEETGLVVEPIKHLMTVSHQYNHATVELHFFIVAPAGSLSDEPLEKLPLLAHFSWTPLSEIGALKFPEANQAAVQQLIENYSHDAVVEKYGSGGRPQAENLQ